MTEKLIVWHTIIWWILKICFFLIVTRNDTHSIVINRSFIEMNEIFLCRETAFRKTGCTFFLCEFSIYYFWKEKNIFFPHFIKWRRRAKPILNECVIFFMILPTQNLASIEENELLFAMKNKIDHRYFFFFKVLWQHFGTDSRIEWCQRAFKSKKNRNRCDVMWTCKMCKLYTHKNKNEISMKRRRTNQWDTLLSSLFLYFSLEMENSKLYDDILCSIFTIFQNIPNLNIKLNMRWTHVTFGLKHFIFHDARIWTTSQFRRKTLKILILICCCFFLLQR